MLHKILLKLASIGLLITTFTIYPISAEEDSLLPKNPRQKMLDSYGSVLDNFSLSSKAKSTKHAANNVASFKRFLWQASIETMSSKPIVASDALGGIISTEWYMDATRPNKKFKVNIVVIDQDAEEPSLQVVVLGKFFANEGWHDLPPQDKLLSTMATDIKQQILQKAQKLGSA